MRLLHANGNRNGFPAVTVEASGFPDRKFRNSSETLCFSCGYHERPSKGDFNAATRRLVKESGFSCALTTVYGMNPARPDVYELKRYNLGKHLVSGEIEVRLSGLFG